jgi:hypothetical protein
VVSRSKPCHSAESDGQKQGLDSNASGYADERFQTVILLGLGVVEGAVDGDLEIGYSSLFKSWGWGV